MKRLTLNPVRRAAKAVAFYAPTYEQTQYLFVQGKSGRINLVGGGIDAGEDPIRALTREMDEEVPNLLRHIAQVAELGTLFGQTTPTGAYAPVLARWDVFSAELIASPETLLAPGDDIDRVLSMTAEEALRHERVCELARRAVEQHLQQYAPAPAGCYRGAAVA